MKAKITPQNTYDWIFSQLRLQEVTFFVGEEMTQARADYARYAHQLYKNADGSVFL